MKIIKYFIIIFFTFIHGTLNANEKEFNEWLVNFKVYALEKKISEKTFNLAMSDVVFLPKVINMTVFNPSSMKIQKLTYPREPLNKK